MKIGIPRGLYFYYFNSFYKYFFDYLDIQLIISPKTNSDILKLGMDIAGDEMCMSLKTYLGHVVYLKDKCDYILISRIANYGEYNQTCTNFLALYDIVNNLVGCKIIDYNIDLKNKDKELEGLVEAFSKFKIKRSKIIKAYYYAVNQSNISFNKKIINNKELLNSNKLKVLLISHPYNLYDEYVGKPIIKLLKENGLEVIDCNYFNKDDCSHFSKHFVPHLYWKYQKEMLGSIGLSKSKIDGIIFLTTFPCGLDSLVNELVMRSVDIPYLNIVIDQTESLSGFETRIESFVDILNQRHERNVKN